VALVPESVRSMKLDGVVFRDVAGAETIDLALAFSRDAPAAVHSLIRALEESGILPPDAVTTDSAPETARLATLVEGPL